MTAGELLVRSGMAPEGVDLASFDDERLRRYFQSLPAAEKARWMEKAKKRPHQFGLTMTVLQESEMSVRDMARKLLGFTPETLSMLDAQGVARLFFERGMTLSPSELCEVTARRATEGVIEQMYYLCPTNGYFHDKFAAYHLVHDDAGNVNVVKVRDIAMLDQDRFDYQFESVPVSEDPICPSGNAIMILRNRVPAAFWYINNVYSDYHPSLQSAQNPLLEFKKNTRPALRKADSIPVTSFIEERKRMEGFAKRLDKDSKACLTPVGFAHVNVRSNCEDFWRSVFGIKGACYDDRRTQDIFGDHLFRVGLSFSLNETLWILDEIRCKRLRAPASWGCFGLAAHDEDGNAYLVTICTRGDSGLIDAEVIDPTNPRIQIAVHGLLVRMPEAPVCWDIREVNFHGYPEAYVLQDLATGKKRRMPFAKYAD